MVRVTTSPTTASGSVPLTTSTVIGVSSEVVMSSTTGVGVWFRNVRWNSRRTQPSSAHINGGSAGAFGPGATKGASSAATHVPAIPKTSLEVVVGVGVGVGSSSAKTVDS